MPTKSSAARSKAGSAGAAPGAAKPASRPGSAATRRAAPAADGLTLLDRAAAGEFPPSLFVDGADEALKAEFLAGYRRAWAAHVPEAPAARVMRPGEDGVDEILAAFHGVSLFTPRELIVVLDVEDFGRSEKRVTALADGVARSGGASCLVLVESAAETMRKTMEPLRAACRVRWTAEPPDSRALLLWGGRRLAAEHVEAGAGVLETLLERCEGESVTFFNELGKLVSMAGLSGRVDKADVESLAQPMIGAELGEFLRAVAMGHGNLAAKRLGRLLAAGESEGSVMFALGNLVGGSLGGWARHRDLSAALARRCPPRELARALDAVYRAEAAWKGGRLDVRTALERATREVAR